MTCTKCKSDRAGYDGLCELCRSGVEQIILDLRLIAKMNHSIDPDDGTCPQCDPSVGFECENCFTRFTCRRAADWMETHK